MTDGEVSTKAVIPKYTVKDLHLGTVTATLDGAAFVSGTTVADPSCVSRHSGLFVVQMQHVRDRSVFCLGRGRRALGGDVAPRHCSQLIARFAAMRASRAARRALARSSGIFCRYRSRPRLESVL